MSIALIPPSFSIIKLIIRQRFMGFGVFLFVLRSFIPMEKICKSGVQIMRNGQSNKIDKNRCSDGSRDYFRYL
jgi:hypothetical protein